MANDITVKFSEEEWTATEAALLSQLRLIDNLIRARSISDTTRSTMTNQRQRLRVALATLQAAACPPHDGGPVGTARYKVS